MQPLIGRYTDAHPLPYSLSFGMASTLVGLLRAGVRAELRGAAGGRGLVGTGSAIFHPEASRIARFASGGQHGLAQSIFQVGGNAGSAAGPLIAAALVIPFGQRSLAWLAIGALVGITLLWRIGTWYKRSHLAAARGAGARRCRRRRAAAQDVVRAIAVLLVLLFSKYFYLASLSSYYTFYLIAKFHTTMEAAQVHLFVFLFAVAAGGLARRTDRRPDRQEARHLGSRSSAWRRSRWRCRTLDLAWTTVFTVIIGFVIASAFSAILVFAQELMPGRVGTVSGLFFGFAFGMGGLGAAVLGAVADARGIEYVYARMRLSAAARHPRRLAARSAVAPGRVAATVAGGGKPDHRRLGPRPAAAARCYAVVAAELDCTRRLIPA